MRKYYTNTSLLKGLILSKNLTQASVAKKLGLSLGGFSKKLHNTLEFKQSEIAELASMLGINHDDGIIALFFCD